MNTRKQMKLLTLQWYWDPFVRIDLTDKEPYETIFAFQEICNTNGAFLSYDM